ncbi:MAG: inositol monophosphatase family protein [Promethearchaeota archaeon]|jgi:myo-inositol-1(or 4)-monophosphatase
MHEPKAFLKTAINAAKEAGKFLLENQFENIELIMSSENNRYYTKLDLTSNKIISEIINSSYPSHSILSEEKKSNQNQVKPSPYTWIIDPLDGTWNYKNGGDWYSISIGLKHKDDIIIGCVYQPSTNKLFSAIRGENYSLCNNQKILPSSSTFFGEWLVSYGIPSKFEEDIPVKFVTNLFKSYESGDTKRPIQLWRFKPGRGAMSLELCYLASGRLNAFVRFKQKPWDVAAGLLIADEAGASITRFNGETWLEDVSNFEYDFSGDYIGVANPDMLSKFLKLLNDGVLEND